MALNFSISQMLMSVQEVLPCVLTTARILQDPTPAVVAQAMLLMWMDALVQVLIIIIVC